MNPLSSQRKRLLASCVGLVLVMFTACNRAPIEKPAEGEPVADLRKGAAPVQGVTKDAAITLKTFVGKVGDRVRVSRVDQTDNDTVTNVGGNEIKSSKKTERTVVHVTEVLQAGKDGAKPVRLKRTFEKAEETNFGKVTKLPLDGRTVIIEKADDKYTFTYDGGGAVVGPSVSEFHGEFNGKSETTAIVAPDKAVKPDDAWDVKARFIEAYQVMFVFAEDKVTASGKLVKTYAKDGKTFGVVEGRLAAPIIEYKGIPRDGLLDGNKIEIEMKFDGCVDGSSPEATITNKFRIHNVFKFVTSIIVTTGTRKVELLPKAAAAEVPQKPPMVNAPVDDGTPARHLTELFEHQMTTYELCTAADKRFNFWRANGAFPGPGGDDLDAYAWIRLTLETDDIAFRDKAATQIGRLMLFMYLGGEQIKC